MEPRQGPTDASTAAEAQAIGLPLCCAASETLRLVTSAASLASQVKRNRPLPSGGTGRGLTVTDVSGPIISSLPRSATHCCKDIGEFLLSLGCCNPLTSFLAVAAAGCCSHHLSHCSVAEAEIDQRALHPNHNDPIDRTGWFPSLGPQKRCLVLFCFFLADGMKRAPL